MSSTQSPHDGDRRDDGEVSKGSEGAGSLTTSRSGRLSVDTGLASPEITLDGKTYVVKHNAAMLALQLLLAGRARLSRRELMELSDLLKPRPDRIVNDLCKQVPPLQRWIDRSGRGYLFDPRLLE